MRPLSIDSLNKIEEFKSLGFAKTSKSLINYMRKNNDPNIRIFRPGSFARAGKSSVRYSCRDIFGHSRFSHIYDIRYSEKFVNYLVDIFISKNPKPDTSIRKAFTRILHNNGLHWDYCCHFKKISNITDDENKIDNNNR